jgi:D-serine deaminase-like pyridoxal phosphate-dependent protein
MSETPELVGLVKADLDTPALLVDLDVLEGNIARIVATCRANGVAWRPHSKAHKSPDIARMQLAAGAIGITCAKLGEAEVMAAAGIRNILIANQIVGPIKIARLMSLLDKVELIVLVDSTKNIDELDRAAAATAKRLSVAIEVNVGMNRAGVEPGAPTLALAKHIAAHSALRLVGLSAWESQATTIADKAEKQRVVAEALSRLNATADECRSAGHSLNIISCGGTGTFPYCAQQPGITEVQVGGGIFSDMRYLTQYHVDFAPALTMLTTVTSRPTATRIVVDAGKKAMSSDAAMPEPLGLGKISSIKLSAEHTKIELAAPSEAPCVGDKLEFIVGYSDTTVHLHETIIGVRSGRVEAVWPVAGRGKLK